MNNIFTRTEVGNLIFWDRDASHIEALIRKLQSSNDIQNSIHTARIKIDDDYYFTNDIKVLPILSELMPGTIKNVNEEKLQITTRTNDVSISKFYTLEGEEVRISELIKKHNLFKGKKNASLTITEFDLLKTCENDIIEKESFWIKELLKINLPDVPFKTKNTKIQERYCTLAMNYVKELKQFIEVDGIVLTSKEYAASLFIIYLSLILQKNNFTVGGFNFKLKTDIMPIYNLFASIVPINFEINNDNVLSKEILRIITSIKLAQENKTYYKDLSFRYPELSGIQKIKYPLSLAFVDDIKVFDEIDGSDLVVIFSNSKGCYWHYNASLFEEKEIKRIQKQFKFFLEESFSMHLNKFSSSKIYSEEGIK